jgi:hypothetical protein
MNLQPLTPQSAGITGPMNINAVIAHLIEMTPGQRKQFAQLHMDDPMMLSAAKFVDNQVTKQAQSLAAQATGAAPPPVNQQVVEQMAPERQQLPEDVGIAQLPAPNMQKVVRAASGGIVAFNGETGSQVKLKNVLGQEIDPSTGYPVVPPYKRAIEAFKDWQEMTDNFARPTNSGPHPRNMPIKDTASANPAAPSVPPAALPSTGAGGGQGSRGGASSPERAIPVSQPPSTGGVRVDTTPTAPVSSGWKETPYTPVQHEGLGSIYNEILSSQGEAVDPFAAQHAESARLRDEMNKADWEAAKARKEGIQTLLSPREKRIADREARLNQQDDLNLNMSMINAGLAMMQSTGKGLAGLAEGAQKGVGQYTEGLKMNEAARQKIEDAKDAFDELKYNLTNMSDKEIEKAKRAIGEGQIASANETISAIAQDRGIKLEAAKTIFMKQIDQMTSQDRMAFDASQNAQNRMYQSGENRANQTWQSIENAKNRAASAAQASATLALHKQLATMPGETQRMIAALGGGDINKGYDIYMKGRQEGGLDKARLAQAEKWLDNNMNNPAFNKNADPKLWEQAKSVVSSSFMPAPVSKPAGPIYNP